jgi:predicted lipid-binding transport protein (Tim44 family)
MNQLSFLDYLMLTLVAIVWWRFFYLAHSPPAAEADAIEPAGLAGGEAAGTSAEPVQSLDDALESICLAGRYDDIGAFLKEAQGIYETIATGFATGEMAPHADLLGDDVHESFEAVIASRNERGESIERSFIGFTATDILAAGMSNGYGWLDIRFETEAVTAVRDRAGSIIAGDPHRVLAHSEIWSFERDFRTKTGWLVTATHNQA